MSVAVLAEKPAVARDIAAVLGATQKGNGVFEGNGYVVTWAIGHLVGIAEPSEINPGWKRWSMGTLPMIPDEWPLAVLPPTKTQFDIVRKVFAERAVERVVCATDAGREGELIFRTIYEAARCRKPVSRLWISSLTPDAIKDGFARLRPARDYDGLADAARGRSRADWLVGMNLSRAYSLVYDDQLSVGRVQTPTLAMVVARDLEIRAFVPEDYLEVIATFSPGAGSYLGTWFRPVAKGEDARKNRRLPPDGEEARRIVERAQTGRAAIASIKSETRRMPPPLLYDLTELQRHANRLYGMSAQRTLDVAQSLYEQHKLITYPRTDSRHLSSAVATTLPAVVNAIGARYPGLIAPGTGQRPLGRRFVDDARVTDHHAILPTTVTSRGGLGPEQERIYDLICRRLLSAWHGDYVESVTSVVTEIVSSDIVDRYASSGTVIDDLGWKVLDVSTRKKAPAKGDDEPDPSLGQALPSGLAKGQSQRVLEAKAVPKRTKPPPHLTDATLLTAMETAGRGLDEKELSDAMRDLGLGTPATRAAILETLLRRELLVRNGKSLEATEKGIRLIEVVHPHAKSPVMTGEWEAKLKRIQRGEHTLPAFMSAIEAYVREVIGDVARGGSAPSRPAPRVESPPPPRPHTSASDLRALLASAFGFQEFRPFQEQVCHAATSGRDLLLVMPTGAGKSLCYQLPGVARGGTTLVVSPLIALMEDQSAKLTAQGFRAERIHSGRSRADSRKACVEYLAGRLDFLFIAPERLRVAGFPEMLAKRPPTLIAVDEAHCISEWGHDFRPDYRLLGQRLPLLRPAPIVALTATATPRVQDDIVLQLGLVDAARFIHGFRRTNLAIEVVEITPSERGPTIKKLLADAARRPAIVYAATRKSTEELARTLGSRMAAAYHAGMDADARSRIQARFLDGELDVIVATIAFGMGIDKANVRTIIHAALPGSVEGYYQEIGRAGRDGGEASAILMHSYVDRKTHEFFQERDYPEPAVLASIFAALGKSPRSREALRKRLDIDEELFEKALEKLETHGGAVADEAGELTRGDGGWEKPYLAQRAHRVAQLVEMGRYAESHGCRMVHLVRHFGDQEDRGEPCGLCDVCAPDRCISRRFREPSTAERSAIKKILGALGSSEGMATGRLHRETFPNDAIDRRSFEHLLGGLVRGGLIELRDEVFEKNGERIRYQRASLTAEARGPRAEMRVSIAERPVKQAKKGKKGKSAYWAAVNRAKKGKKGRKKKIR